MLSPFFDAGGSKPELGRRWGKWHMREREGSLIEGRYIVHQRFMLAFGDPPPEGKPTFPTSIGLIGGGGSEMARRQLMEVGG